MIITKQRMNGYTPLRQRDIPISVEQIQPQSVYLTTSSSLLATASEKSVAPVAPDTQIATSVAPALSPEVYAETSSDASSATTGARLSQMSVNKQRMAGYTPLRLRIGQAPNFVAVPGVRAADDSSTSQESAEACTVPKHIATSVITGSVVAPIPKNRMEGYTPLRQRPGTIPSSTPVATQTAPAPELEDSTVVVTTTAAPKTQQQETQKAHPEPRHTAEQKQPPRWLRPALFVASAVVVAFIVVLAARGLRSLESIQTFVSTYDGHSTMPDSAPTGMPWWMGWQHFFNMFFIALIIRTGLQIRQEKRPAAMWTPRAGSIYSPKSNVPKKVSITTWLHQTLDVLWVVNGLIFVVLLVVTGHWMRIVPTSWDIFPNMASVALQYASFDWPAENGWIHYNALQMVSYFLVVFIAAPLAVLTGVRMSSWWPNTNAILNKIYPVEVARMVHFPVMLFFVFFVMAHVFLVFTTGALRNLNHMYTSRDVADFWGLVVFLVSVGGTALVWVVLRPALVIPIASKVGTVSKN